MLIVCVTFYGLEALCEFFAKTGNYPELHLPLQTPVFALNRQFSHPCVYSSAYFLLVESLFLLS